MFLAILSGGVAFVVAGVRTERATNSEASEPVGDADGSAATPAAESPAATQTPTEPESVPDAVELGASAGARSLSKIAWTVSTPSTLEELGQAWSLPSEMLVALNPELPTTERLASGTEVVVHTGSIAGSESVGPPNDGRLIGGLPFPEGPTWSLPADRSRAFGTGETLVGVLAALDSYAAKYPDAAPIQLGELSARRGGPIYGHQSHQTGRDIDIRLVVDKAGDRFDGERNWLLVKTLIDSGDVVAIFLNRSQQVWLRAAAEADVGVMEAEAYFMTIRHEPGHTIHVHVRFRCPDSDRRCVVYTVGETDEEAPKVSKLPGGGGGTLRPGKGGKLTLRPKIKPGPLSKPSKPGLPGKKPSRLPTKGR